MSRTLYHWTLSPSELCVSVAPSNNIIQANETKLRPYNYKNDGVGNEREWSVEMKEVVGLVAKAGASDKKKKKRRTASFGGPKKPTISKKALEEAMGFAEEVRTPRTTCTVFGTRPHILLSWQPIRRCGDVYWPTTRGGLQLRPRRRRRWKRRWLKTTRSKKTTTPRTRVTQKVRSVRLSTTGHAYWPALILSPGRMLSDEEGTSWSRRQGNVVLRPGEFIAYKRPVRGQDVP